MKQHKYLITIEHEDGTERHIKVAAKKECILAVIDYAESLCGKGDTPYVDVIKD